MDAAQRLFHKVVRERGDAGGELRREVEATQDVVVLRRQRLLAAFPGGDGLALDVHALSQGFLAELKTLAQELRFVR